LIAEFDAQVPVPFEFLIREETSREEMLREEASREESAPRSA